MMPDESHVVYRGNLIDVTRERWGNREREIVEHPDAVAMVPITRDGLVALVRQLREATRTRLVELPAGKCDEGEEPLSTAQRELREEGVLTRGGWTLLSPFWTPPGFCRERMHVSLAEGVDAG